MDRVPSLRYQRAKTAASAAMNNGVESVYGTPRPTCSTSAAIVPNTLTMTIAVQ